MRENVRAFVKVAAAAWQLAGPVYEFGAYRVAGQEQAADLRGLFAGGLYFGCDMRPGPGVDRVEDLAKLSLPDGCARTIICVDTLEHVFEARRAVDEMIRVLAPGGMLLVAAPMDFRVHDYPSDYWRLTPSCLARLLEPLDGTVIGWQGVESHPHTVFGVGCKGPVGGGFSRGAGRFVDGFQAWLAGRRATVGWRTKLKNTLAGVVRSKGERRRIRDQHRAQFAVSLPVRSKSDLVSFLPPSKSAAGGSFKEAA